MRIKSWSASRPRWALASFTPPYRARLYSNWRRRRNRNHRKIAAATAHQGLGFLLLSTVLFAAHSSRPLEVPEPRPWPDPNGSRHRIDPDPVHVREVDHHPAVTDGVARDVVSRPPHGEEEVVFARETHGGHHVSGTRRTDDDARPAVDHRVVDGPRLVVSLVARPDHPTADRVLEAADGAVVRRGRGCSHR